MFDFLPNIFHKDLSKDQIAKLLRTNKTALEAFETAYQSQVLNNDAMPENFFEVNAKQAASMHEGIPAEANADVNDIISRIVEELVNQTPVWEYDGKMATARPAIQKTIDHPVTNEEIKALPEELRPWLTGNLMKVDINTPSYLTLLDTYQMYKKEKNPKKKKYLYDHFRQGLDILDMDGITYEMIDTNPTSMSHWLPQMVESVSIQNFFKIPKTTIIKVPVTMLQLTRCDYMSLNRTTLDIVDKFCQQVFRLDESKDYFIKTGTYSSKYDFRNAHVHGAKEVRELGEYLLFIHHQACQMAAPLNNRCIYGVSTTTEWVVREFIQDTENNPCIYNGLPLHTEYRVFVDFDTKEVLGMNPYWDPQVMKQRFGHEEDANTPEKIHDYVIYSAHEDVLMNRYHENESMIREQVTRLVQDTEGLSGQWSIDIMQNGNDFWLIDMAPAAISALNHCVPKNRLKQMQENWIPDLSKKDI